ncbi:heterokaryon incompatibility, partial [Lophium mytilinum]
IQCDIIHTSIARPPQYVAVSHRWDSSGAPQEMILLDGGLFPVSRSIHSLLMAKRSNLHPRYFWIDSICINQKDNVEKSKQVGLMRNIYEEADMTLGWLGEDPGAKKAVSLIKRIAGITSVDALSSLCSEPDSGWIEFEKFMSNEWFERVWIVQEIA